MPPGQENGGGWGGNERKPLPCAREGQENRENDPSWHRYGDACLGVDGHRQCAASMGDPGMEWVNDEQVV